MQTKPEAGYSCTKCEKAFSTRRDLMLHQYIHKEKPHAHFCAFCNKTFPTDLAYKRHQRLHSRKRRQMICRICDEAFEYSRDLEDHHRRYHLDEKMFKCEKCGLVFSWQENLEKHIRMHEVETHTCTQCGRGFMDSTSLRIHMRTHQTKEEQEDHKPFLCKVCNRSFRFDFSFEAHMNSHDQERIDSVTAATAQSSSDCVPRHREIVVEVVNVPQLPTGGEMVNGAEVIAVGEEHEDSDEIIIKMDEPKQRRSKAVNLVKDHKGNNAGLLKATTSVLVKSESSGALVNPLGRRSNPLKIQLDKRNKLPPLKCDYVMSEEKPFTCNVCNDSFRWEVSLQIHLKTHQDGYVQQKGRGGMSRRGSRGKQKAIGTKASSGNMQRSQIVSQRACSDDEEDYQADDSVYIKLEDGVVKIISKSELKKQKVATHGSISDAHYPRPQPMNKSRVMRNFLKWDVKCRNQRSAYPCMFCRHVCTRKLSTVLHRRHHLGTRAVHCQTCSQKFADRKTMLLHRMNVHLGNATWVCDLCGKGQKSHFYLSLHKRRHVCRAIPSRFKHIVKLPSRPTGWQIGQWQLKKKQTS